MAIQDILNLVDSAWFTLGVGMFFFGVVFLLGLLVGKKAVKPEMIRVRMREHSKPSDLIPSNRFIYGMNMARRQSVRRTGNQIEVLVSSEESREACRPAKILDRSRGGLCLVLPEPATVGSRLYIRTAQCPDLLPWAMIEVKYCLDNGGDWRVGCQFLVQPTEEVLICFG